MTQSSSSGKVVERFVFLPFSVIGGDCSSHSSIQVAGGNSSAAATDQKTSEPRRRRLPTKSQSKPRRQRTKETRWDDEEDEAAGRERRPYWSAAAWCSTENTRRRRNDNKSGGHDRPSGDNNDKSNAGMNKLVTTIKASISQLFVYKQSGEEEEEEKEMEIGFPTDVKHVTHIGLDGSTTTHDHNPTTNTPTKALDDDVDQIISFPTISLKQFELAMAAQAHAHTFNLVHTTSSNLIA